MYIRKLTRQVILDYGKAEVCTKSGMLRGVISDGTYIFRGRALCTGAAVSHAGSADALGKA